MAAPTTGPKGSPVIDSLAGADANPIGSPYVDSITASNKSDFQRLSNQLAPTSSTLAASQAYRNEGPYPQDFEGWFQLTNLGVQATDYFDYFCRLTTPLSQDSNYIMEYANQATDTWTIFKRVKATGTTVGSFTAFNATVNNYYAFTVVGSGPVVFELFEWDNVSAWVSKGTLTDSTPAYVMGEGMIGFEMVRGSTFRVGIIGGGGIYTSRKPPLSIPNRLVGPMALRHKFRQPTKPSVTAGGAQQVLAPAGINGVATVSATVVRTRARTGTVNGVATVSASVVRTRARTGTVNGVATVSGSIVRTRVISISTHGVATVTAIVGRTRPVTGTITGRATVTVGLVRTRLITATPNGVATVSAVISGTGGSAATSSTADGWVSYIYK